MDPSILSCVAFCYLLFLMHLNTFRILPRFTVSELPTSYLRLVDNLSLFLAFSIDCGDWPGGVPWRCPLETFTAGEILSCVYH